MGDRAIAGKFALAVAGDRVDRAILQIDPADAVVADIGHVEHASIAERDAVRLAKLRLRGRAAVAGETRGSGARDGRDLAGGRVNAPHEVVLHFHKVHVAGAVEADFVGLVEFGVGGRPAIAGVSLGSIAGDAGQMARVAIEPQHAMLADRRDVESAIRTDLHAKWLIYGRFQRRARAIERAELPLPATVSTTSTSGSNPAATAPAASAIDRNAMRRHAAPGRSFIGVLT